MSTLPCPRRSPARHRLWALSAAPRIVLLRLSRYPFVSVLAGLLASTGAGYADPGSAPSAVALPGVGSGFLSVVRVLGALALVLVLLFAGLWVWRNWQRLIARQGPAPRLAILEGKPLGNRHTLFVIGYERQRMLVAASPAGVTMLSALPPEEPATQPVAEVEAVPPSAPAFGALLMRAITHRS